MYIRNNCNLTPFDFKGKVTMLFVAHQVSHGLHIDEVLNFNGVQNASGENTKSNNLLKTEE